MFSFHLVLVHPSREVVPVIIRIIRVGGSEIWKFLVGGGQIYNGGVIFVLVIVTRGWGHLAVE